MEQGIRLGGVVLRLWLATSRRSFLPEAPSGGAVSRGVMAFSPSETFQRPWTVREDEELEEETRLTTSALGQHLEAIHAPC